jgi:predicted transglutaminase-like protease
MAILVKLDDIIDAMELQTDETTSYLNKETGRVATITDEEFRAAEDDKSIEDFPDWQHENIRIAKEVLETDDYISLPSKFDINEYGIMERFSLSIADDEIRDTMCRSIKGRGAF